MMTSKQATKYLAIILSAFCSQHVLALQTPEPSFDGSSIVWKTVDARSINIHRADGSYIESIAGSSTQWTVPETGRYFLVASDDGDWTGWARSETVDADLSVEGKETDNDLALTNVTSAVYSSSAIELFWDNYSRTPFTKVEVSRDKSVIGLSEGISFYESGLAAGTTYNYTLTPYDAEGNKGVSSSVSLATTGSGGANTAPDKPPVGSIDDAYVPFPPEALRADVYSSSSVELFWEHASDYDAQVVSYNIYQDGEIIQEFRIGTSVYISDLAKATTYVFSVGTVANALEESELQTIVVSTTGSKSSTDSIGQINIEVVENTISWPDDGWYQVQSSTTYESLCNGGRSCEVPPGEYWVINHTIDERTLIEIAPENSPIVDNSEDLVFIDFDITVPEYVSNALQVDLVWGNLTISAEYGVDESWYTYLGFPVNDENLLEVTFYDDNGGIILGKAFQYLSTRANMDEQLVISANQFNIDLWDNDADGISNIDELRQGTDPNVGLPVEPTPREPEELYSFFAPSGLHTLSWVSGFFEANIPADRPYFEFTEEIPTTGFDTDRTTRTVSIDIDSTGSGIFSDEAIARTSFNSDATIWESNAVRSNDGSSITWEGTYYTVNNSAYRGTDITFMTQTALIDENTRSQTGEITRGGVGLPIPDIDISYAITGKVIAGTSRCEPVSGTISYDAEYLMNGSNDETNFYTTTVAKEIDEEFWTVTDRTLDGEFVEQYFAESIGADFYCDSADL